MGRSKIKGKRRRYGVIGGKQKQDEELIGKTEVYKEKKKLEVNTSKTKIIRFRKEESKIEKKKLKIKNEKKLRR